MIVWFFFAPYKNLENFKNLPSSTFIFDRDENLIQVTAVENSIRRENLSLNKIPSSVCEAFINAEDKRFYFHKGIDFRSVFRALFQNLKERRTVSGASTISMQLARMIGQETKRNFFVKVKTSVNAVRLELRLSKPEILELYLNHLPFGYNVEGVGCASRFFFNKTPENLLESEIEVLVKIPRNPKIYAPEKLYPWPFFAPHFVHRLLEENHSKNYIKTSLDLSLQNLSENLVSSKLQDEDYKSRIKNACAFAIENETGNIICYCGSNNWKDEENGGKIDGIRAKNQMGSTLKPFLYALCLEKEIIRPNDVIPDIPREFGDEFVYIPMNFNNQFHGPVLARTSLASSLNIGAVTLVSRIGSDNFLSFLKDAGFDSLNSVNGDRAELGLALGAGEVTLEELTRGFSIFANKGKNPDGIQILSPETCFVITDFLSDKASRSTGFGFSQSFETDYESIFKTGTANQFQSIVAVGSVPRWTVGVWMGNFDGNTVIGKTGSSLPGFIAKQMLDFLVEKYGAENDSFEESGDFERKPVCSVSGLIPNKYCPTITRELFKKGSYENTEKCSWHKVKDGKVILVLDEEYQHWKNINDVNIGLDYGQRKLEIKSPKNGSIFFEAAGENSDGEKINVEVIGGIKSEKSDVLKVEFDKDIFYVERPFMFSLPTKKGVHNLKVTLGNESDFVAFEVK